MQMGEILIQTAKWFGIQKLAITYFAIRLSAKEEKSHLANNHRCDQWLGIFHLLYSMQLVIFKTL